MVRIEPADSSGKSDPSVWSRRARYIHEHGPFSDFAIDERVAAAFGELKSVARKRGRPIADADLLIAATAKVERLIVAKLNNRHFEGLPGVATEDCSK